MNYVEVNIKESNTMVLRFNAAGGIRFVSRKILTVTAKTSNVLDLQHMQCYLMAEVCLSLAHSDRILLKTDNTELTKVLEKILDVALTDVTYRPIATNVAGTSSSTNQIALVAGFRRVSSLAFSLVHS